MEIDNVYIILGSSIYDELIWRVNTFLKIYNPNSIVILSGTNNEVEKMSILLENKIVNNSYIVKETLSRNTIDNIINTFSILFNIRNLQIPQSDMSGHTDFVEVIRYNSYHIISSDYHINRIKFICSVLDKTKNLDIVYHSANTENPDILKYRLLNETKINVESYRYHILNYNL